MRRAMLGVLLLAVVPLVFSQTGVQYTPPTAGLGGSGTQGNRAVKTLTESTPTLFVRWSVPSNGAVGGLVRYCVYAQDATPDYQARCGSVPVSGINKAGTETCTAGVASDILAQSAVSTLTVGFTTETAGTNECGILANGVSGLTQTVLEIRYAVDIYGGTSTVTPQP